MPSKQSPSVPAPVALSGFGHEHLAPPGWSPGIPLDRLLEQAAFSTAEAVAVVLAVLDLAGSLHSRGGAHGGISPAGVGVRADGRVLVAAAEAAEASPDDDLAACGQLLCALLDVPVEPDPLGVVVPGERAAPALVAIGRALAFTPEEWTAGGAAAAIRDAAGFSGTEPQLARAAADLGARAHEGDAVARAVDQVFQSTGPPLEARETPVVLPEPAGAALPLGEPGVAAVPLPGLPAGALTAGALTALRPWLRRLPRPGRRAGAFLSAWFALLLLSAFVTAAARMGSGVTSAHAAAAPRRAASASPAAAPGGLYAQTPTAAVATFFQLVQEGRLDRAALLWKPKMAGAVDLRTRFGGLRQVQLVQNRLLAEDDSLGIATVAVDWIETGADGQTGEYSGMIFTDTGPYLWRWDSWRISQVLPTPPAAPPPPSLGGSGGSGGGGGDGDGG